MRNIAYGAAIVAGVILAAILVGRQPPPATASQFKANNIMDLHALEATIDMKALPRQDIPAEVYE